MCVCVLECESMTCADVGVRGWSDLAYLFYMPHILVISAGMR